MYFFYDMPHNTECVNPCSLMDFLPKEIVSKYANRERVLTIGFQYGDITNDNERIGYEIITGKRYIMSIDKIRKAEEKFINSNIGHGVF